MIIESTSENVGIMHFENAYVRMYFNHSNLIKNESYLTSTLAQY